MPARSTTTLLVIDDDPIIREIVRAGCAEIGFNVLEADASASGIAAFKDAIPDVTLIDVNLPDATGLGTFNKLQAIDSRVPTIFITASSGSENAIEAMKMGAYDYVLKPLDLAVLLPLLKRAAESRRLMRDVVEIDELSDARPGDDETFIGSCPAMYEIYKAIGRVAQRNVPVLILGESGTGKELIARAVYAHSQRSRGPFVAINCASIPEALLESELFGHEKGSFTGADRQRIGKFEQCAGGTLFLDEIGDMPLVLQGKLLRVLQERKFQRVGGNETIEADVAIIAATHRDLGLMIEQKQFRSDLYYRVNTYTITVPPIRDRGGDLYELVHYMVRKYGRSLGTRVRAVEPRALEALGSYSWPGNVRELQGVIKRAILDASGPIIMHDDLPESIKSIGGASNRSAKEGDGDASPLDGLSGFVNDLLRSGSSEIYRRAVEAMERAAITGVLEQTQWRQTQAAEILGITRGTLRQKLKALGISITRSPQEED